MKTNCFDSIPDDMETLKLVVGKHGFYIGAVYNNEDPGSKKEIRRRINIGG